MRKWIKGAATTAFLTAGLFAFGMGAAQADVTSSGDGSIAGGAQILNDVNVPVNVCGNAVGALVGVANAACIDGDAKVNEHHDHGHGYYY